MKDNLYRLLLSLAALGLSERDTEELLDSLRDMSSDEIVSAVSKIRREQRIYDFELSQTDSIRRRVQSKQSDSLGSRVSQLLRKEAKLGTLESVDALTKELTKSGKLLPNDIPPLSHKSLEDWIDRLAQRVPSKEILRVATLIRNERVHTPLRDWELSRSKND
jgi:hypothetical protein